MITFDFEYDDASAAPVANTPDLNAPMCLELSPIPGPNRARCFCTESPGHEGQHIAGQNLNNKRPVQLAWVDDNNNEGN